MSQKINIGVIGCGAISNAYFTGCKNFPILHMAAVADLDPDRAKAKAAEHHIPKVSSVDELMRDPTIDIILNLTIPSAHVPVALQALHAGKHTYCEKPLGISRQQALPLLSLAKEKNLRVGCAPDTFLGAGQQTARKLLDDGAIGRPVAFTAFMLCPGHESWHPSPEFYYQPGGGPMLDMGPYYLTALLNLLGPVKRITGLSSTAIPERTITSKPKFGTKIKVETPDQVFGLMEFQNGAAGSILTSFATRFPTCDNQQPITLYGTEGTLRIPDPNQFDGPVHIKRIGDADWSEVPPSSPVGYSRATGLADMAHAIRANRGLRCDISQAFTVLDLMQGFQDSSDTGRTYEPHLPYVRPAPMPTNLSFGILDNEF